MKFLKDSSGQDIIEYMLLTAFLALATYGGMIVLSNTMERTYEDRDRAMQLLWETPEPIK